MSPITEITCSNVLERINIDWKIVSTITSLNILKNCLANLKIDPYSLVWFNQNCYAILRLLASLSINVLTEVEPVDSDDFIDQLDVLLLRTIRGTMNEYIQAIDSFKNKYRCFPLTKVSKEIIKMNRDLQKIRTFVDNTELKMFHLDKAIKYQADLEQMYNFLQGNKREFTLTYIYWIIDWILKIINPINWFKGGA